MPQPQAFRYQIWKGLVGAAMGGVWFVGPLLAIAMGGHVGVSSARLGPTGVLVLLALLGLALLAYSLHLLTDRRPILTLDERGVTDLRFSPDPVPWQAVTSWHEGGRA